MCSTLHRYANNPNYKKGESYLILDNFCNRSMSLRQLHFRFIFSPSALSSNAKCTEHFAIGVQGGSIPLASPSILISRN